VWTIVGQGVKCRFERIPFNGGEQNGQEPVSDEVKVSRGRRSKTDSGKASDSRKPQDLVVMPGN
jgi:hypothetical protein